MDQLRTFFKGAIPGLVGFVVLLDTSGTYFTAIMKVGGIIVIPFITGLLTVLGNDFYKHKIKNKLFPNADKKSREDDEEKTA